MDTLISPTTTLEIQKPLSPILNAGDPETKREEIRRYFHDTYDAYEALFAPLVGNEAFITRADPLRHPLMFYFGHTATFFINKLILAKLLTDRVNPMFENIFAIGVDEMSWDDLNDAHYEWPHFSEVAEYRTQIREVIDDLITRLPLQLPIDWNSPFWPIMMGIEHERIHLETSSVLIRHLPLELVEPHSLWPVCEVDHQAPTNGLLDVVGGKVVLGKTHPAALYGWDNEYGHHEADVPGFKAGKYLVSNREFLEFVEDDGYANEKYWTEEGWSWVNYEGVSFPRFWRKDDEGNFQLRCMLQVIAMPWSWPVETNQLEAKAFCNWKAAKIGKPVRLPTEDEWYRLLDHSGTPDVLDWKRTPGNLNLERFASPEPVDTHPFGGGFFDILGNVWQHTETPISGFAGFEVHPLYDDFSTPTFDLKHNMIKGGSWIATGNEIIRDSRYAFRRHFYQHAGFRYIESVAPVNIPDDRYETDPEIVPFCELNYGADYLGVVNNPAKLAMLCLEKMEGRKTRHAFNYGCNAGRTTFELARVFDQVTGSDFTARIIRMGVEMKEKGYTQYTLRDEGDIVSFHQKHLADFGLDGTRDKVDFVQGDLSNLKQIYTGYDLVIIDSMLERTNNPTAFLQQVHQRLNVGGLLVIASTNDWLETFTAKKNWLGGYKENGENVTTLDSLQRILGPHFRMIAPPEDVPSVIRKTRRSFDHNVVQVTFWELLD